MAHLNKNLAWSLNEIAQRVVYEASESVSVNKWKTDGEKMFTLLIP